MAAIFGRKGSVNKFEGFVATLEKDDWRVAGQVAAHPHMGVDPVGQLLTWPLTARAGFRNPIASLLSKA
ncbi:hypothetical protein [Mesorhizobium sp.]|uniref:hypothetical protein n=1 Tax=Mesorhizobium sp. TaxID=1871066 RepID=UPI000FE803C2|nr:hypothetical protein [Mesorhizobium sp.]RWI04241.1 MAG: hypothetical protein EOQ90_31285 [Mesorhizobium sp.]RWL18040.1 MAG: hypothetical protein EOR57_21965 [Mesorhizobium sp.]TIP41320.1 MAG: hypothetical protein E5X62_25580 [Mesorhizobium sp.]TIP70734.1 MAG: hypothetical protein E5X55_25900 [Mesorhizobium sp.]TIQ19715.1 MAG: hypothetical protein E5X51_19350 [Mesorhizobium sp.]